MINFNQANPLKIVLDLVNQDNGTAFDITKFTFGVPGVAQAPTQNRDSQIVMTAGEGSGYVVGSSVTLKYNRINLDALRLGGPPPVFSKGQKVSVRELIPEINALYTIQLHENDIVEANLPVFTGDIVLVVSPTCVVYKGSLTVNILAASVGEDLGAMDGALDGLVYTAPSGDIIDLAVLETEVGQLDPLGSPAPVLRYEILDGEMNPPMLNGSWMYGAAGYGGNAVLANNIGGSLSEGRTESQNYALTRDYGATWEYGNMGLPGTPRFWNLTFGGGYWFATSDSHPIMAVGQIVDDGMEWNSVNVPTQSNTSPVGRYAAFGNEMLMLFSMSSFTADSVLVTADQGQTWARHTTPSVAGLPKLWFADGLFYLRDNMATPRKTWYSEDGQTWTEAASQPDLSFMGEQIVSILGNGRTVANDDNGNMLTTTDGRDGWQIIPMENDGTKGHYLPCRVNFRAVSYAFDFESSNDMTLASTDNGIAWDVEPNVFDQTFGPQIVIEFAQTVLQVDYAGERTRRIRDLNTLS